MKEITIKLYNIHELKEVNNAAYKKVVDDARDILIDDNFYFASEDVQSKLKESYNIEVDNNNIWFSISYCQGDGVCFTKNNLLSYTRIKEAKNMNAFEEWIVNNLSNSDLALLLEYLNCNYNLSIIKTSHHYCHAYTCTIDYEFFYSTDDEEKQKLINNFISGLCDILFKEVYIGICSSLEKMLYSYYDISEEDITDFIDCNDYNYDENGVLY